MENLPLHIVGMWTQKDIRPTSTDQTIESPQLATRVKRCVKAELLGEREDGKTGTVFLGREDSEGVGVVFSLGHRRDKQLEGV